MEVEAAKAAFLLVQEAQEASTGRLVVACYGQQWPAHVAHRGGLTLAIFAPPVLHTAAAAEDSSVGAGLARCLGYVGGGFAQLCGAVRCVGSY